MNQLTSIFVSWELSQVSCRFFLTKLSDNSHDIYLTKIVCVSHSFNDYLVTYIHLFALVCILSWTWMLQSEILIYYLLSPFAKRFKKVFWVYACEYTYGWIVSFPEIWEDCYLLSTIFFARLFLNSANYFVIFFVTLVLNCI